MGRFTIKPQRGNAFYIDTGDKSMDAIIRYLDPFVMLSECEKECIRLKGGDVLTHKSGESYLIVKVFGNKIPLKNYVSKWIRNARNFCESL
jgi:hypothetical protein